MLGIRFVEASPERIVAEMMVRDDMCTTPGVLHGGAIMAFADSIGATGTAVNLPPGAGTTTTRVEDELLLGGPRRRDGARRERAAASRAADDGVADAGDESRRAGCWRS